MKVLAINASARKDGNTAILIQKVFEELNAAGIETEMIQLAGSIIEPCKACWACGGQNNCVHRNDMFREIYEKMLDADGILLGSPVYAANVSANMQAFLERAAVVGDMNMEGRTMKHKVGAAVASARRGGALQAVDTINHFFLNHEMYVAGSTYWNIGYGQMPGDVMQDAEGLTIMKNLGKIVFLDVDGTLMDYENNIPQSAILAIRKARENGHKVYFCTGRSKAEISSKLWDIGLDGMIGGNGSYVEDNGHVVMHQVITLEQCRHIVDYLHEKGLEFYLESNNGLFASENLEVRALPVIQEYSRRKEKPGADKMTVRQLFPELIFGGELYRDDLNKISYILNSYQDFLDTKERFPDMENGTWGGSGETALFGDLGVKEITKGNAIAHLLTYLGADKEDTIAFGDAKIDIPMLKYCKIGVAMGNGGPEIKEMADFITDDVGNDGIYNAFVKLGLIE